VETLPVEYLGVVRGALGPGIDLHLVELKGEVGKSVGIASGMSGSPVYFSGRLFGALGYRLGTIPRRAVGGVVRIEDMEAAGLATASAPGGSAAVPIATPLTIVGASPATLGWIAPRLAELGLTAAPAGGGSGELTTAPPEPGSPVGVELVRGDLRIAATGTATRIENGVVHAFGHSFVGVGKVEFPLVTAEVVHVLEDMAGSTKITNLGPEVGAILDDRVTAVVGRLGERARMIPVRILLSGASFDHTERAYEMVDAPILTPLLLAATVTNAALGGVGREVDLTLRIRGRVALEGLPDLPLDLAFAAEPGADPAGVAAGAIQQIFAALYANPFREPRVRGVDLTIDAMPGARRYTVEDILYDRGPVHAGSDIELVCVLQERRGGQRRETMRLHVPDDLGPGTRLAVAVGGPDALEAARGKPLAARLSGARDLKTWIAAMADRRADSVLAAELVRADRGLIASGTEYDELPGTARRLLATSGRGPGKRLSVAALDRRELDLDGLVAGGMMARFVVEGEAGEEE